MIVHEDHCEALKLNNLSRKSTNISWNIKLTYEDIKF